MKDTQKYIKNWLFVCALAIIIMIVIGGLTRLTGSGLSMVNWKPLTGWVPPLSNETWQQEFDFYKTSPQFKLINVQMDLLSFKKIFVLEFIHRLWGRLIGIIFAIPFFYFLIRGRLNKQQIVKYSFYLFLGGVQGLLGWYMVKSGLIDVPRISPYRLTAHLILALICYSLIIVEFFKMSKIKMIQLSKKSYLPLLFTSFLVGQIIIGGFTAGLEAGRGYNTFPLMDGQLIPDNLFFFDSFWRNFFENATMVQFLHRLGAFSLLILASIYIFNFWRQKHLRLGLLFLIVTILVQFLLGVSVLIMFRYNKPIELAVIHQFFAVVLLTISLYLNYKISYKRLP